MKKGLRKIIIASSFLVFILYTFTFQPLNSNGSQPPSGQTNDPVNLSSCAQHGCHSSFSAFNSLHVTVTIGTSLGNQVPLTGFQYLAGTQYIITFTALGGSAKPGFEMSALTYTNANAGTFAVTNQANTSLSTASNIKYIGHKNASSVNTWNFNWTAPSTNVGNITFYSALNRSNNDNASGGDSIFLQQFAITPVPFSVSAGNTVTICPTTSTQLQATPTNNPGAVTYVWSPTAGLSCNTCANPVATPSSSTTYTVTATSSGQTATNTVTVNLYPSFTPAINTTSNYICPGATDTLSSSGYNAYSWSTGSTSATAFITQTGTYILTATNTNNCKASNSIIIQQGQAPSPNISSSKPYLCAGTGDTLFAGNFSNYLWNNNANTSFINATHGGAYAVTVTNSQGCSASASYNVTAYASPIANITPNGPLTFCTGGSVLLKADTSSSYTYKWSNGLTASSINITQSGTYTVTVYNPCDSAVSTPNVITVNPNVEPGVTISPSNNNICQGSPVTFTPTPTNGGGSPSYQWKKNGNNVGTNPNYTDSTLANNDTVTCVITSNAVCASPSTATSNSIGIIVKPTLNPTIGITASQTTTCPGGTVVFTATFNNEGTSPIYQWIKNEINVGTNSPTYIDSTLNNNDSVACMLTSNVDCASSPVVTSSGITITLSNSAVPSVAIAAPSAICAGTTTTFVATPTNGGSNPSYQWIKNGNNVGTNADTYSDDSIINNDTIICVMASNASCVSTLNATSNTIITAITPAVTPAITVYGDASSICAGTPVSFFATPISGGTAPSYQWKKNGNNTGPDSSIYTTTSLSNNDVISCVMTSNADCASPASVISDSVTITVTQVFTPTATIIVNPNDTVCSGATLSFLAGISHGGAAPLFQWQVNGNNVTGNGNSYSSNLLADSAQVNVILTSSAACVSSSTVISNIITVRIKPLPPTPTITALGADSLICNTSADSYTWLLNNTTTSFNTQTIKPVQSGLYKVIIAVNTCVSDTSPGYSFIINGVEQLTTSDIKTYPNPVSDFLNFSLTLQAEAYLKIAVMGLDGRNMIQQKSMWLNTGENNFEEDFSTLPNGIYIMYLQSPDFMRAIKIVKQN